jgi:hypothetical protein
LKLDYSASSFLTLAKYGTGKTVLRCEYAKSLKTYIERFVKRKSKNEENCENVNCLSEWIENEFAQLILSTLVTEFINTMQNKKNVMKDISIAEKIELITIMC